MRFYKPLFSLIVITIQLILSIINYIVFKNWAKENPELDGLVNRIFHGDSLFFFVAIIGVFEMMTRPGWFKTVIRVFLASIVLGAQFSGIVPIESFFFGVYNTAWFSAVIAGILIMVKIFRYLISSKSDNKFNKASR